MADKKSGRDEESFIIESQDEKTRREARNVKIGACAVAGILLLSVFTTVASLTGQEYKTYKGPPPEVKADEIRGAYHPAP